MARAGPAIAVLARNEEKNQRVMGEKQLSRERLSPRLSNPEEAPEPLFFWGPERAILSPALPSSLTAIGRSLNPN